MADQGLGFRVRFRVGFRVPNLTQSLENCGKIRREPCGRNSNDRQEIAKDSKGMTYSVNKSMVGSAFFAGLSVGGSLQSWLG